MIEDISTVSKSTLNYAHGSRTRGCDIHVALRWVQFANQAPGSRCSGRHRCTLHVTRPRPQFNTRDQRVALVTKEPLITQVRRSLQNATCTIWNIENVTLNTYQVEKLKRADTKRAQHAPVVAHMVNTSVTNTYTQTKRMFENHHQFHHAYRLLGTQL